MNEKIKIIKLCVLIHRTISVVKSSGSTHISLRFDILAVMLHVKSTAFNTSKLEDIES